MEMLRIKLGVLLLAFMVIGLVSCNDDDDDNNNNNNNNKDRKRNEAFLKEVSQSNQVEIELGKMASEKGADSSVIEFGKMMKKDHEDAQDEIDSLGTYRGIVFNDSLNAQNKALKVRLTGLTGFNFDTAYINSQKWMHTKTKDLFEAVKDTTNDQALKKYVNKYLPEITMHLHAVDSISNLVLEADTTKTDATHMVMRLSR